MSEVFAVMHVNQGEKSPSFSIISANDAADALAAAAQACVDAGHPDAAIVAVFDRADLSRLDEQMKRVEDEARAGSQG